MVVIQDYQNKSCLLAIEFANLIKVFIPTLNVAVLTIIDCNLSLISSLFGLWIFTNIVFNLFSLSSISFTRSSSADLYAFLFFIYKLYDILIYMMVLLNMILLNGICTNSTE